MHFQLSENRSTGSERDTKMFRFKAKIFAYIFGLFCAYFLHRLCLLYNLQCRFYNLGYIKLNVGYKKNKFDKNIISFIECTLVTIYLTKVDFIEPVYLQKKISL